MFQTKSFHSSSFSSRSWRLSDLISAIGNVYNITRIYITTRMNRTVLRSGKRSTVVNELKHVARIK